MIRTGTQNRPYDEATRIMVRATFMAATGHRDYLDFNWNDRAQVRNFAAQSDRIIRDGGSTHLSRID